METTLTGRTRYAERRRLFRSPVTVLEVEQRIEYDHWYNAGRAGVEVDHVVRTEWRRATVADILNLERDGTLPPPMAERMTALLAA